MAKTYFNDVVPNYAEEKEVRKNLQRQIDQSRRDLENRQKQKYNRILQNKALGIDKFSQTIDTIIEFAEASQSEKFTIYCYYFDFEETIHVRGIFESFLDKLKASNCFKDWKKGSPSINPSYIFDSVKINSLRKYKNMMQQENEQDSTSYFRFDGMNLRLKLLSGGSAVINFQPKENEGSDMFYLMSALVFLFDNNGRVKNGRKTVRYSKEEVLDYIKRRFRNPLKNASVDWFKNTKGNLVKKIPNEYKKLINIGGYDNELRTYLFSVKLPI